MDDIVLNEKGNGVVISFKEPIERHEAFNYISNLLKTYYSSDMPDISFHKFKNLGIRMQTDEHKKRRPDEVTFTLVGDYTNESRGRPTTLLKNRILAYFNVRPTNTLSYEVQFVKRIINFPSLEVIPDEDGTKQEAIGFRNYNKTQ